MILLYVRLLLLLCSSTSLESKYDNTRVLFVTPATNIPCPGKPCLTLLHYIEEQNNFFKENVELCFLPGVHNLTDALNIKGGTNITRFNLIGLSESQSNILSSEQGAIHLNKIQAVSLESLWFSGSNNITIENATSLVIRNTHFSSNDGQGFVFDNIENITAININISNSTSVSSPSVIRRSNGYLVNTIILSNDGSTVFSLENSTVQLKMFTAINNTASGQSILRIADSEASFIGFTNVSFNWCKSTVGSVSIINSSVSLSDQTFINSNSAKEGGAIYLDNSILILTGSVNITNNSATSTKFGGLKHGGAIKSTNSIIAMAGLVTFSYNRNVGSFGTIAMGGAISLHTSSLKISGSIEFCHNYVEAFPSYGGAIQLINSTIIATPASLRFTNNSAQSGGAIAIPNYLNIDNVNLRSTVIIEGSTIFDSNEAEDLGGALYGDGMLDLNFVGNTTLTRNRGRTVACIAITQIHSTAAAATASIKFQRFMEIKHSISPKVAVSIANNVTAVFSGRNNILNNSCARILEGSKHASYVFLGVTTFSQNHGATLVLTTSCVFLISGEANITDNDSGITADSSEVNLQSDVTFTHNKGSCLTLLKSNLTMNGTLVFNENTAVIGPALTSFDSKIHMLGQNYNFSHNTAEDSGGVMYVQGSEVHVYVHNCTYLANTARSGGAVYAITSDVYLSGHQAFTSNRAVTGGAISIGLSTVVHFDDLEMIYENNEAERGAIIYVNDVLNSIDCSTDLALQAIGPLTIPSKCFYSMPQNFKVMHSGNLANDKGNILFGGNLKHCNRQNADDIFITSFRSDRSIQNITSKPYRIAFCEGGKIVGTYKSVIPIDTVPGKSFSIASAGLDQLGNPVYSTIRTVIPSNTIARLGRFESKQDINNSCTELTYHLFTSASIINLTIYAEGPCNTLGTASRIVSVKLGPCPDGFELTDDECTCTADLLKYTSSCNVDNGTIRNDGNFWAAGLYTNGSYEGIMAFSHCPFDYCKQHAVDFTLQDPDTQCDHNRSGIICGQCRMNYSLTFGEGECRVCSDNHLLTFGLVLLFALLGIILVILLIMLKLTVVTGTLNGLIFYANIIDASRDIFIPQIGWSRTFISWLNLDFGFRVCFYEGMDTFAYTWMQFLFPFYIWMLIGIIITISHYSVWMTKRVGSSPIAVLATLILLSYTKLLRTIISVFYFAIIQLPNRQTMTVWLYDGNLQFLHTKHLALFIFALLFFALVFIPYNLLLMFGPLLRRISGNRDDKSRVMAKIKKGLLGWYEDFRVKMLFDAYTIPYNEAYHYWTGVLLLVRCVLLLVSASSAFRNSSTTILSITMVILGATFLVRLFTGRIYRSWFVDTLEAVFLLNLGVFSVATYHNKLTQGNQQILADISVGISLVLFIVIILYHAIIQTRRTRLFEAVYTKLRANCFDRDGGLPDQQTLTETNDSEDVVPLTSYISLPTNTETDISMT